MSQYCQGVHYSKETDPAPCTLGRALSMIGLKALRILPRRRAASLSPFDSFLYHSTSVRLWGSALAAIITVSKRQHSQPSIFAVTIIVVELGRPPYLYLFPSRLLQ